jgi:toxin-antitoxin system PIN domain toxin
LTTFLLDVNLLLALTDPRHIHHTAAQRWFADGPNLSWATSAITENGFIRVASHPSYPNRPGDFAAVAGVLKQIRQFPGHEFWAEDVSILDVLEPGALVPSGQTTDVYLLGLAASRKGRLATLDGRIPTSAVKGGSTALEVVPAS